MSTRPMTPTYVMRKATEPSESQPAAGRLRVRPNLPLATALLFGSIVLILIARVIELPRIAVEVFGLPAPVVGRVTLFLLALLPLFASYTYAIYSLRLSPGRRRGRLVLAVTALLSLPPLLNFDLFSRDVYPYIYYARMISVHALNPYVVLPTDAPTDPFLSWVDGRNLLSPYGPLWTTWSVLLERLMPGGVAAHVLAFKASAAVTHLVNTVLVGAVMRKASPRNTALAMAAYGWNPLPLFEFAGNAHNDSLMLAFVLSALLAYYYRRPLLGALLLGMAIATKFTAALFVPLYVMALLRREEGVRRKSRRLGVVGAIIAGVWVVGWLPYAGDGGWRRMVSVPEQAGWYLNSIPALIYHGIRDLIVGLWRVAPMQAGDMANLLVTLAGLVVILIVGVKLSNRIQQRSDLVEMWFWFMFAYLFFVGSYFWPWYATTLVSLAALTRKPYVWFVTTVFSLNALVVYSCSDCRAYVTSADSPLTGLTIFALPLLTLAALARREKAHKETVESVPKYG